MNDLFGNIDSTEKIERYNNSVDSLGEANKKIASQIIKLLRESNSTVCDAKRILAVCYSTTETAGRLSSKNESEVL